MKQNKIKAPIKLVIAICDRGMGEEIEEYLNKIHLKGGLVFMGKGTAESEIADIFGFGLSDRDIVAILVPTEKVDKVVENVRNITRIEDDKYGLVMTMPLSGATNMLLDAINIKVGE